jgi:hypothetical protein
MKIVRYLIVSGFALGGCSMPGDPFPRPWESAAGPPTPRAAFSSNPDLDGRLDARYPAFSSKGLGW